jgi:acylphosphatase
MTGGPANPPHTTPAGDEGASTVVRAHVWVSGRVQGVFFRACTEDEARARGVTGWVCNTRDGRVEAVFEGGRADVEDMVRWCHRGSPGAVVSHVQVQWERPQGEPGFRVRG